MNSFIEWDFEDFEKLKEQIHDKDDFYLFEEIFKCINSECYRSASILIWISTAESLKRKLEYLSKNDNEISEFKEKYDNSEKDYDLLLACKNARLIKPNEYYKLEAIRQDRNNYAHPSFESPSKTDVLINLRYSVKYALSKPYYRSMGYVHYITDKLFEDSSYLGNPNESQVKNYALNFFKQIDPKYLKKTIKLFFKSCERLFLNQDSTKFKCQKHALIYIDTFFSIHEDFLDEHTINDFLDKYKHTSCHIFSKVNLWDKIDKRSQERIFSYSKDKNIFSEIEFINIFYKLYSEDKLNEEHENDFKEYLSELKIINISQSELPANFYFDNLVKEFETGDYYKQIDAVHIVQNNDLNCLDDNQLKLLGILIMEAAQHNSWASQDFIRNFEINKPTSQSILRGMFEWIFINDENKMIFRYDCWNWFSILLDKEIPLKIIEELLENIENTKIHTNFSTYNRIIECINDLKIDGVISDKIINSMKKVRCKAINHYSTDLLNMNGAKVLAPYLLECLTEDKKQKFSEALLNKPLNAIKFFTTFKRNGILKIEVIEVNWNLIKQFIKIEDLLLKINKLNVEEYSGEDKLIIEHIQNYDI